MNRANMAAIMPEVPEGASDDVRLEGDFVDGVTYYVVLYSESGVTDGFQWEEGAKDYPAMQDGEHVITTFDRMMEADETDTGG